MKPAEHKLVLEVFDENRLTRDDFLGQVELSLLNLPREVEGRQIPHRHFKLQPRRLVYRSVSPSVTKRWDGYISFTVTYLHITVNPSLLIFSLTDKV